MTHRNAPLAVEGRHRSVIEVLERGRPIAHVAAEFHIAGSTLTKWVGRYRQQGPAGLHDHPSTPHRQPGRLPTDTVALIEQWRRQHKWSAHRITRELADQHGIRCCPRTVTRWLDRLGLNRIRDITPTGEQLRRPGKTPPAIPGTWSTWT